MTAALLACEGVRAGYGGATVVRDLDLELAEGTVLALLGPNGAGKTTLLSTLAGLQPSLGGVVSVDGKPLRSGRPLLANQSGIVLVPDHRALFTTLTVAENLECARRRGADPARKLLDLFPALEARWNVSAGSLSGGEQQMLAIARGLIQRPRVLLIDEMSMGLAPVLVQGLLPIVRRIASETGAVVILVEQHVSMALAVADQAMVLVHGTVALAGPAAELAADPAALEAAYLGEAG